MSAVATPARASAIYAGRVRHRRMTPVPHEFSARLSMMYLDLQELPALLATRGLFSTRRPALVRFRRADYLGDPAVPLDEAVRDLVCERTGTRPDGPIRLLTHLRTFGHNFNPVSFYYCYDGAGEQVSALVAEVTNTPWHERHAYVMAVGERADHGSVNVMSQRLDKEFHVSPFMGMDHTYDWRLSEPGERLSVHIESSREGQTVFDATLSLRRREISGRALAATLVRDPLQTLRIVAGIYIHAVRLKLKGAPYFPHPRREGAASPDPTKEAWSA